MGVDPNHCVSFSKSSQSIRIHSDFQGTGMIPFLASAHSHVPEITIAMLMRLRSRSCHHVRNIALWNSATGGKFPEVPTRCVLFFHGFNPLTNEFKFSQVVSPLRSWASGRCQPADVVRAPECLPRDARPSCSPSTSARHLLGHCPANPSRSGHHYATCASCISCASGAGPGPKRCGNQRSINARGAHTSRAPDQGLAAMVRWHRSTPRRI